MAEGTGFEPVVLKNTGHRISSATHSTALPTLPIAVSLPIFYFIILKLIFAPEQYLPAYHLQKLLYYPGWYLVFF